MRIEKSGEHEYCYYGDNGIISSRISGERKLVEADNEIIATTYYTAN